MGNSIFEDRIDGFPTEEYDMDSIVYRRKNAQLLDFQVVATEVI